MGAEQSGRARDQNQQVQSPPAAAIDKGAAGVKWEAYRVESYDLPKVADEIFRRATANGDRDDAFAVFDIDDTLLDTSGDHTEADPVGVSVGIDVFRLAVRHGVRAVCITGRADTAFTRSATEDSFRRLGLLDADGRVPEIHYTPPDRRASLACIGGWKCQKRGEIPGEIVLLVGDNWIDLVCWQDNGTEAFLDLVHLDDDEYYVLLFPDFPGRIGLKMPTGGGSAKRQRVATMLAAEGRG